MRVLSSLFAGEGAKVEGMNLVEGVDIIEVRGAIPEQINDLCCDSRHLQAGDLFIALRGFSVDGHKFLPDAAKKGAGGAVVEQIDDQVAIPQIRVNDTLAALPRLAANFYSHPSRELYLIGITGSNGKTTATYILENIWKTAGIDPAVIGTIQYRFGNNTLDAPNTTPLAHDMQKLLRKITDSGIKWVIMEVSSHGIALHRIDEMHFNAALFLNLSQDHLDFHPDMEDYRETKKRLFSEFLSPQGTAVINIDDEAGRRIRDEINVENMVTFAIERKADVIARNIQTELHETRFDLEISGNELSIRTSLIGLHNVYNILGAAAIAWSCQLPIDSIRQGIEKMQCVPGRLEVVPNSIGAQVVVDYCHTPDALEKCLIALSAIPHKRLVTVFGCGGDRDRKKRPLMGGAALKYSDYVIVTSDNPRTEDPNRIIQDIEAGMSDSPDQYEVITNRKDALKAAIEMLQPEDILLIAGKGHETYQILGRTKIHFDDREYAREFLQETGKGVMD